MSPGKSQWFYRGDKKSNISNKYQSTNALGSIFKEKESQIQGSESEPVSANKHQRKISYIEGSPIIEYVDSINNSDDCGEVQDQNIEEMKRKSYLKNLETYDKFKNEMRKSIDDAVERVNTITKGIESNSFFLYPEDNDLESLRGSTNNNMANDLNKYSKSYQKCR